MSIAQKPDSTYPRTWDFRKDGELPGRHRELRAVKAPDFTTQEPVDKVVWESKHNETGEIVSVWVDGKVLRGAFADELRQRKLKGTTLQPDELVTITPLGVQKPKKPGGAPYNGFRVVFEHGVPPVTAEQLLLEDGASDDGSDDALGEATAEPPIGGQLAPDDLPF